MTQPRLTAEIRDLLQPEGIHSLTNVGALNVAEVDHLLRSDAAIRCIITSANHNWAHWLIAPELNERWQQEIRPMMGVGDRRWEGWYEASEWRTDQDEPIIMFVHIYVPI